MRLKEYLNEAQYIKEDLKQDIDEFIKTDQFYKYSKTPEDFRGSCDGVSTDLLYFLKDKGYNASLVQGTGALFNLPKDHPHKDIPQYVTHIAVKVNNKIVDLTGLQFEFDKVRIMTPAQFKKEFKTIKPFKPFR